MSSKFGRSTTTGPFAEICPECLSKAGPGDAGLCDEGEEGPSKGVLGLCCPVGGVVPPTQPNGAAEDDGGWRVDVGSRGMFFMFSTSMSSSSVSGGLFSSL